MFEAYDPSTCTNSILHLARAQLLLEVEGKVELLLPSAIQETLEAILFYRLHITRHPVNGVLLEIETRTRPKIFDDEDRRR